MKDELNLGRELWFHCIANVMLAVGGIFVLASNFHWHSGSACVVALVSLAIGAVLLNRRAHRPILTWCDDLQMKLASLPLTEAERASLSAWALGQLEIAAAKSKKAINERDRQGCTLKLLEERSFPSQNPSQLLSTRRAFGKELSEARHYLKRATKSAEREHKRYLRIWDLFMGAKILPVFSDMMPTDPAVFRDSVSA